MTSQAQIRVVSSGGQASLNLITPFILVAANDAPANVKAASAFPCDGTNDEEQIINALAALPSTGGKILLSTGTFNIGEPSGQSGSQVIKLTDNDHIAGMGMGATILNFTAGRGVGFDRYIFGTTIGAAYGTTQWSIRDMSLQCRDAQDHGMQIKGASQGLIENVHIKHMGDSTSTDEGIQFSSANGDSVRYVVVREVHVEDFGAAGIELAASSNLNTCHDIFFENCLLEGNLHGFKTRNLPNNIYLNNSVMRNNTADGVNLNQCRRLFVTNNEIYSNTVDGIDCQDATAGLEARDIVISGNAIHNNGAVGVILGGLRQSLVNNVIYDNGTNTALADTARTAIKDLGLGNNKITGNHMHVESIQSEDTTVSGTETNGSAAVDDTGAVFGSTVRDGAHWIRITDAGGDVLTGYIGTNDAGGDDTEIEVYNSAARSTQNWIEGGSTAFDMSDTPLTYDVYLEAQPYAMRLGNGANPYIDGNHIESGITGFIDAHASSAESYGRNTGYVTYNSGLGSVASGDTTDVITHGLSGTPTIDKIKITFAEQGTNDYGRWSVGTIGAATFTVTVAADPGASNLDFGWEAAL